MARKSARPWSSFVMAMMRGRPAFWHSSHNAMVAGWISSPAGITNTAASAARNPGAQLPDVLGVTGGVQEVDLHVPGGDGGQGEGGRSLGGVLLTAITLHPGAQEVLEEGGLSRPAGTDEDDITDLLGRTDCYVSTRL